MHVLFENIMKALLSAWAGTYKMGTITEGEQDRLKDDFVIGDRTVAWKAMSREVAESNSLVPSSIGARVQDLDARGWWTAETYSYFLLFLGPIILKGRLSTEYFVHFLRLSDIARTITKIEIEKNKLDDLRRKIAQWVLDYERQVLSIIPVICTILISKPQTNTDCTISTNPLIFPSARRLYMRFYTSSTIFLRKVLHVVTGVLRWKDTVDG
jgi:hypothetical protein